MTWDDVLIKAVLIIVSAIGPIITALAAIAINKLNGKINDDRLKNYTSLLGEIVTAAVGHAQQTIVEGIKEKSADGKLTAEEARQIKETVLESIISTLPSYAYDFLYEAEVDVETLIDSLIEAEVYATKRTPVK